MIDDWWRSENEAREQMRAAHAEIAALTELGFAVLGEGLESLERRPLEPWETVCGFAATQLHNTLRAARELAFAGYGVQSLALARLADEFLVLLWWIPNHRDQAPAWLDAESERRKTAGAMAKEVFAHDAEAGARHKELHEALHRFAHQDALAFTAIYGGTKDHTTTLQIGPLLEAGQLRGAAVYILTFLALGAHTLSEIAPAADDGQTRRVREYVDRVDEWRERTDREEHARLVALGYDLPAFDEL